MRWPDPLFTIFSLCMICFILYIMFSQTPPLLIPKGSTVSVRVAGSPTSNSAQISDTIGIFAAEDLVIQTPDGEGGLSNDTVIAKGALGGGTVTYVVQPLDSLRHGSLSVQFDWISAINGQKIPLAQHGSFLNSSLAGQAAVINAATTFTAEVAADTWLKTQRGLMDYVALSLFILYFFVNMISSILPDEEILPKDSKIPVRFTESRIPQLTQGMNFVPFFAADDITVKHQIVIKKGAQGMARIFERDPIPPRTRAAHEAKFTSHPHSLRLHFAWMYAVDHTKIPLDPQEVILSNAATLKSGEFMTRAGGDTKIATTETKVDSRYGKTYEYGPPHDDDTSI